MYPAFNIYQSILSGWWQPALPHNRDPAQFDHLLQAVRPVNGCLCSSFFYRLATWPGQPHGPCAKDFRPEALRLAALCGCGGSNVFLSHPAAGSRERFYNLLIGYSLQNYEEWISQVLTRHCRSEAGQWFHYRLVERLLSLLADGLPFHDKTTELLIIVGRTKTAVAILLDRMITAMPLRKNGFHLSLWPREELKNALAACDLALPARNEVLALYDKATSDSRLPAPATGEADGSSESHLAGNLLLNKLLEDMQKDKPLQEQLKKLLEIKKDQQETPGSDEGDYSIDGAEACRILGINRKTLSRISKAEQFEFTNIGGKYFFRKSDIYAYKKKRSNIKKPGTRNKRPPG